MAQTPNFTAVVELQLGDRHEVHNYVISHMKAAAPLQAGDWESYPHGNDDLRLVTLDDGTVRQETAAEHKDRIMGYCYTFIQNQHDYGTPPLAWRIKVNGKIVEEGTASDAG